MKFIDKACWFLMGMMTFILIAMMVTGDCSEIFWPLWTIGCCIICLSIKS